MIKNIIFDLNGVIRGAKSCLVTDFLSKGDDELYFDIYKGIYSHEINAKYKYLPIYKEWDKGLATNDELLNELYKLGQDLPEIVKQSFYYPLQKENNFLYKETISLIKKLKKENYNIYILSNMNRDVADIMLNEFLDNSLFDDIIFSCDIAKLKPNKDIYEYAINKWGIKTEESIFIDDKKVNLKPFEELGGITFHFKTNDITESIKELRKVINKNKK